MPGKVKEGLFIMNRQGMIVLTNMGFDNLFDYERKELIGRHISILAPYSSEEDARIYRGIITNLRDHGKWSGELPACMREGGQLFIQVALQPLGDAHDGYWIGIVKDVTEQKKKKSMG
jgi:PAS domain S-box-containing protein